MSHLIDFIENVNLNNFDESIEYTSYNFFKNNNISFDKLEKLDLFWFDTYTKQKFFFNSFSILLKKSCMLGFYEKFNFFILIKRT